MELQSSIPGLEISDDDDELPRQKKKQKVTFSKFDAKSEDEFDMEEPEDEKEEPEFEKDSDPEDINQYSESEEEKNPLLANLETDKNTSKANTWFNKVFFFIISTKIN